MRFSRTCLADSLSLVLRSIRPHHAPTPVFPLAVKLPLVKRIVGEAKQPLAMPQPVVPIAVVNLEISMVRMLDEVAAFLLFFGHTAIGTQYIIQNHGGIV